MSVEVKGDSCVGVAEKFLSDFYISPDQIRPGLRSRPRRVPRTVPGAYLLADRSHTHLKVRKAGAGIDIAHALDPVAPDP